MPELPEVETIRRSLVPHLYADVIAAVPLLDPHAVAEPEPDAIVALLPGQRITAINRRAKFLVFALDTLNLVVHLRMSGRLKLTRPVEDIRYLRAQWNLASGHVLCFYDVRRFGRIWLVDDARLAELFAPLGPEPFDSALTVDVLSERLARRTTSLKSLLLNQHFLAGLGNIYVDEVLFACKLHPRRSADSLTEKEAAALLNTTRDILRSAIANGGTTFDAVYSDAEGKPGRYREYLAVYRRAGEPCLNCGTPIERIVVAQRGTHLCPRCQR
ncbi:MAG: bifunctional DNA-formamidopyrimidine glycosylase/DNA-(apurinic or apyrimidinic site) lyase [Chloroflexota bacterium]|nr:bifunctional DNA-formamidopyrimidine glycosylase/DNA-(apurinic or apyrimidinic site) lyase [Chloroflexota bacterium]MDE2931047.1 bifunctional DNA-formamidopyrimidine glycosylase/DNA-(apurinic or apyrimidinic site) lyase [Chloroflexota bacterium]